MRTLEDRALLLLVIAVSLAFAWILWPFFSAVLWATVLAIVFAPLYRRILRSIGRNPNLAALATLLIIVMLVILPLFLTAASLVQEATSLYERIQSGELNLGTVFQQLRAALPAWVIDILDRLGLTSLGAVQDRLSDALKRGSQFIAAQALSIGQGAADFILGLLVMLYLLFFLLREGGELFKRIQDAIPLPPEQKRALFSKFTTVIRATIKGSIFVAAVQGALGGLIFWLLSLHAPVLWGVVMGLLALLPAVGAAAIWFPAAIYLLATGSTWQGVVLSCIRCIRDRAHRQYLAAAVSRQGHQDARLCCADLHARRPCDFRTERVCPRSRHRGDVHRRLGYLLCIHERAS